MRSTSEPVLLPLRGINATVRFLLELCALAALAVWGFGASHETAVRIVLGIGAPAAAAIVWGLFVAPRARFPLPTTARSGGELLVFGSAALAILASGPLPLAVIFAVLALGNMFLTNYWHQWEAARAAMLRTPQREGGREAA
jgi:hypothetical protein